MIAYLATPQKMTSSVTKPRSWKALVRRAFELWGAPYANGPYMPL